MKTTRHHVRLLSLAALVLAPHVARAQDQVRFEESAASYSGTWYASTYSRHSGGSALVAEKGTAAFSFRGTAVRWISYRDEYSGIARVYLDGQVMGLVDLYASPAQVQPAVFEASGLSPGDHTLAIEVIGSRNEGSEAHWVTVDAFDVELSPTVTRVEQDDPAASYTGTWYPGSYAGHSGGSAVSAADAGARVSFEFTGTGVTWIGYRDEWSGTANVYLDGELKGTVDTYASPFQAQAALFSIDGLAAGSHKLVVEVTGARNPASGGSWVTVDAFDVESLPPPVAFTRSEQDDPAVAYVGLWQTRQGTEHSGGSLSYANYLGASATFSFVGTGVKWIGYGNHATGIARVYVDGVPVGVVDTYAFPPKAQATWFVIGGLPKGLHTLTIEVTETKNPLSQGTSIALDAFDVIP